MKRVLFLVLIMMLSLTGCKEDESNENEPVIEDNTSTENQFPQDDSQGNPSNQEDEIIEPAPAFLTPIATITSGARLKVENGEVIEYITLNTFSGVFYYENQEIKVSFDWYFDGVTTIYQTREPHNSYFVTTYPYDNKLLWCYAADASVNKYAYYICDLEANTMEQAIDYELIKDKNISNIAKMPDSKKAIATSYNKAYYYDGINLVELELLKGTSGVEFYEITPLLVDSKFCLICRGSTGSKEYLASYSYDDDNGILEKTFEMEYTVSTQIFLIRNEPFAIWKKDGYLTFLNLLSGRMNETNLKVDEASEWTTITEKYHLIVTTDGMLMVFNKANGRLVGQSELPILMPEWPYFSIIPSDEDVYVGVHAEQSVIVYKIDIEE